MRGLTPKEREVLAEIKDDTDSAQEDIAEGDWPWPDSVVDKLIHDGRVHLFVCPSCSTKRGGDTVHVLVTPLGRLALRLSSVQKSVTL